MFSVQLMSIARVRERGSLHCFFSVEEDHPVCELVPPVGQVLCQLDQEGGAGAPVVSANERRGHSFRVVAASDYDRWAPAGNRRGDIVIGIGPRAVLALKTRIYEQ